MIRFIYLQIIRVGFALEESKQLVQVDVGLVHSGTLTQSTIFDILRIGLPLILAGTFLIDPAYFAAYNQSFHCFQLIIAMAFVSGSILWDKWLVLR